MNKEIITETHPIEPWLPENAKVLMCGTFPPPRDRWSMDFYYPNFINDMWRIFGLVFHSDKDYYVDTANKTFRLAEIKRLLLEKGIALSDTGREVHRMKGNASDKFLEILQPIDLAATLALLPECEAVATTGEKAAGIVAEQTGTNVPKVGEWVDIRVATDIPGYFRPLRHWRMPSTSRAYPLSLEKKAEFYRILFRSVFIV